jgi:hypothetical protein
VYALATCWTSSQYEWSAEKNGEAGWDEAPDPPRVGQRQRPRCALDCSSLVRSFAAPAPAPPAPPASPVQPSLQPPPQAMLRRLTVFSSFCSPCRVSCGDTGRAQRVRGIR